MGVQIGREAVDLVAADAAEARWDLEIELVDRDEGIDFRGPAVHGTRGERFIYLTWRNLGPSGNFEMFRRAKLMLHRIVGVRLDDPDTRAALETSALVARVDLTGADGAPRCARVDPPAIAWSVGRAT